jgi:hypothetical protein
VRSLFLALLLAAAPLTPHPELDGTVWTMRVSGIAGLFAPADVMSFDAGSFTSSECVKKGFAATGYDFDGKAWSAVQTSEGGGKVEWTGTRNGDAMAGTLVWTKPGGKPSRYSWTATIRR